MISKTISALYHFQLDYLFKLVDNIPDERLYEKQLEGINSAGWILGHIFVESEDVLRFLNIQFETNEYWNSLFQNTTGVIKNLDNLPTKQELTSAIKIRYEKLHSVYLNLSDEQRVSSHPSVLIKDMLPDLDSWFAHHLTTHISIHCGNLTTWKKIVGIEVNGY